MLDSRGYSIDEVMTAKKKSKNKRRFDDEQIKSLEVMFENESRLEPKKKMELAEELGLQPRQVAIWFQNKRARWKSKQLERDYTVLQGNYDTLASCFKNLEKEKHDLQNQVQKLKDMLNEPREESVAAATNSGDTESSENGETERCESEVQPGGSMERSQHTCVLRALSDHDLAMKAEYFVQEDKPLVINMVDRLNDGGPTQDWGCFETDGFFEQSSSSSGYQWWDFWS